MFRNWSLTTLKPGEKTAPFRRRAGDKPGRGRTQKAAAYIKSTTGQVEVDDQFRGNAKTNWNLPSDVGVGRAPRPIRLPPSTPVCAARAPCVRRGPKACEGRLSGNEPPHRNWVAVVGAIGRIALAPISRGVQRRDLARTRRPLPARAVEGTGGARRKGYAPSTPRTTG